MDGVNNRTWSRTKFDQDVFPLFSNITLLSLQKEDCHWNKQSLNLSRITCYLSFQFQIVDMLKTDYRFCSHLFCNIRCTSLVFFYLEVARVLFKQKMNIVILYWKVKLNISAHVNGPYYCNNRSQCLFVKMKKHSEQRYVEISLTVEKLIHER